MDAVAKDVTKEYKKAKKKRTIIAIVFNFIISIGLIIAGFLPVGKIGNYSIGNIFQLVTKYFDGLFNKNYSSVNELGFFLILYGIFVFIGICWLIYTFCSLKQEKENTKVYIDEKNESFVISFKFIIEEVVYFFILLIICYPLIEINNLALSKYAFTSNWDIVITLVFLLIFVKSVSCSFITLKYDEKGEDSPKYILNPEQKRKAKQEKKEKIKKNKNLKKKNILNILRSIRNKAIVSILILIFVGIYGCSIYYNAMFGGYNLFGFDSVAGWVVAPFDEDLLKFDRCCLTKGTNKLVKNEGFGDCNIELEYMGNGQYEDNTKEFYFYGDSYDYAMSKIEELEKEIKELKPKDSSEEAFKEYLEEIVNMSKAVEQLKKNIDRNIYPYEYVNFVDGYMVDLQFNATGKNDIKWGVKETGLKSLIFREKITLTDRYCQNKKDMERFAVGTDFNKELIVARVQYSDGSVRISKVKPTNIEELNNAGVGKQILKWADSWGEYQTTITLYN